MLLSRGSVLGLVRTKMNFTIDGMDHKGMTCLMKAAINNFEDIVRILINFGANPRLQNEKGDTALSLACINENFQICERLIISKADINQMDPMGRTPLLKCAHYNSKPEILQLLIDHGADSNICDYEGYTLLHFAALRES